MFRYSLVYTLRNAEHPLCQLVKSYADRMGGVAFPPHITVRHSLSFAGALKMHEMFTSHYNMPDIVFLEEVHTTSTLLLNANGKQVSFYAIEQPLLVNMQRVPGLHVSLAYKVGSPFTLSERDLVRPWSGRLGSDEIKLCVFSCHSKSPKFWRTVM